MKQIQRGLATASWRSKWLDFDLEGKGAHTKPYEANSKQSGNGLLELQNSLILIWKEKVPKRSHMKQIPSSLATACWSSKMV